MVTIQEAFEAAEGFGDDEALNTDPIEDGGQVEGEGQQASEGSTEPSYFDLDAHGDQLVRIKVDGVEQDVPLKELPSGYMRQQAFTQKTQQLAADRQRLQAAETLAAAYERNPVETVKFLAQQQGITLAQAQAQAEAASGEQEGTWANEAYVDPRLSVLEQQIERIVARDAEQELERTLSNLGTRYGDDFNAEEVVNAAITLNTTDLEGVYKQLAFDRMLVRSQAAKQFVDQQAAKDTQVTQAKQQLAQTVASGESFKGAGAPAAAPIKSIAEALERALADLDMNI